MDFIESFVSARKYYSHQAASFTTIIASLVRIISKLDIEVFHFVYYHGRLTHLSCALATTTFVTTSETVTTTVHCVYTRKLRLLRSATNRRPV